MCCQFDSDKNFNSSVEKKFMFEHNLKCNLDFRGGSSAGCFQRLFSICKNEVCKTIDRNLSKHNVQIHLKNKDKHAKDNKIN